MTGSGAGVRARNGLGETWGALAEVCSELSEAEWARPTECPGWDVKDQLSHLIGIERAIMGEPVPEWTGPLGDHVKNDFAATNERFVAVRRALPGPSVRAEFVEVTTTPDGPVGRTHRRGLGRRRLQPHGRGAVRRVHDGCGSSTAGCTSRTFGAPSTARAGTGTLASEISLDHVQRAMPFVVGKKAGCADGTAVRFDVAGPGTRRARLHHRRRGRPCAPDRR